MTAFPMELLGINLGEVMAVDSGTFMAKYVRTGVTVRYWIRKAPDGERHTFDVHWSSGARVPTNWYGSFEVAMSGLRRLLVQRGHAVFGGAR